MKYIPLNLLVWTRNGKSPKEQAGLNLCGCEMADPAFNL